MKIKYKNLLILFLLSIVYCFLIISGFTVLKAQVILDAEQINIDYSNPRTYEIGGITISGTQYLDNNILITLSGLTVGDKIEVPGDKITKAIQNLWKQGLFENIKISVSKINGGVIFLNIYLEEKPRLSKFTFTGLRKSEANSLKDKTKLTKGDVVTENLIMRTSNLIKNHFTDKGYMNTNVNIIQKRDTSVTNNVILIINVNKGKKGKIGKITFIGNKILSEAKLKRLMKKTKEHKFFRIFTASKFIESEYKADKQKIIEKYNEIGFRDARIVNDSVYKEKFGVRSSEFGVSNKNKDEQPGKYINIDIKVDEGNKYYFRNITWVGNSKYTSEELSRVLKINKGEIYNQKRLDANLYMNLEGQDVSSLYLDDGYLFFNVTPVEKQVENDSIDIEFRIYEGKQARINKVYISGNTKTNDHVILREIRTRPGQLFNRSDIIRSQRELAQLKYFNAEKIQINPKPNPQNGTVDIEYVVEETSSDQLELSGGWGGAATGLVGTLGVSFNNFSLRKIARRDAWRPLPSGDGQKLSLRVQANGRQYQSYNASFTEPWLGGKKPNSLSVSFYNSIQTNGLAKGEASRQAINIYGASVGLGKRITWPDDFFTLYQEVGYQNYKLENYLSTFLFADGTSNNIFYNITLARNSFDAPIFPRTGSSISLSLKVTPPFSLFTDKDYSALSAQDKYKLIEYHKWNFNTSWFTKLAGNLVLNTRLRYGFMGDFNRGIGISPFERYYVGGSGLSGFSLDGREIIAMRGYADYSLTPRNNSGYIGGSIFNKYTIELRYPLSLNPMATIYLLGFAEAGNAWTKFKEFNAFDVKRSAGFGIRVFLPMFGLLGLDWGYGFDEIPGNPGNNKGQFHFSIGQSIE